MRDCKLAEQGRIRDYGLTETGFNCERLWSNRKGLIVRGYGLTEQHLNVRDYGLTGQHKRETYELTEQGRISCEKLWTKRIGFNCERL